MKARRTHAVPLSRQVLELLTELKAITGGQGYIFPAFHRGGEGPEHLALKNYVCANPQVVGLKFCDPDGETEYGLPSGDCVDVVFAQKRRLHAVEVKPAGSGPDDIARGLFQCVKYRAVIMAKAAYEHDDRPITVCLALGGTMPVTLIPLRNSLGIEVFESIMPH